MKYLKIYAVIMLLILSTGFTSITKGEYTPLTANQLKSMFPDDNFRSVILTYFNNEEITVNKLKTLDGELYASGENISDLTGISYLQNINDIILWNNNINVLPNEITNLGNLRSINISNNYLTDDTVVKQLLKKNIDVNYDLNFIDNESHQYQLKSNKDTLYIKRGETLKISDLIYKDVDYHSRTWEVCHDISNNIKFNINSDNDNIKLNNNMCIEGVSLGESKVNITLLNSHNQNSSTTLNIKIR